MKSHPDIWDPKKHTLELYKSLVAFVMAYRWDIDKLFDFIELMSMHSLIINDIFFSFQEPVEDEDEEEDDKEPNPPMMVPMADMLNHVSKHNANLEYTPVCGAYVLFFMLDA